MAHIVLAICNVDYSLVDEKKKNGMLEKSDEFGALISKLRLDDDEMSIRTYIQIKGEKII